MADMKMTLDGNFLRYSGTVLNRVEVAESDVENGWVLMRSGHTYNLPPEVLKAWFSDQFDYSKLPSDGNKR